MLFQNIGKERVLITTLFGDNININVINLHRKVMLEHFNLQINYIKCPFPQVSHGSCINYIIKNTIDEKDPPDYYWFIDIDCIALQKRAIEIMFDMVRNKITIWGHAWQSNHKIGPNGTVFHPYAGPACLCFSREIYNQLKRPDMDHNGKYSDTAEELTYAAKQNGYNIALIYPSSSITSDCRLDNGFSYGFGNIYGSNLWFHCSDTSHKDHVSLFCSKCQDVLNNKFELVSNISNI